MLVARLLDIFRGLLFYKMLGLESKNLGLEDEPKESYFQYCFIRSNFDMGVKKKGLGFDRINR